MGLNLFQILYIIFFVFISIRLVSLLKKGSIHLLAYLFWMALWILGTIFVLIPDFSVFIAKVFGIARGVDVVVYISIICLFYFNYKVYSKINQINKRLKNLNTYLALDKIKEDSSD